MAQNSCSLIISVYKNVQYLNLVLESVKKQTFKDFEVIISQDGDDRTIGEYLEKSQCTFPIIHLTQKDLGWRKNKALNRAIEASGSDYLVFIDGDCLLHPRFMEQHISNKKEKVVLGGKRIKLDPLTTDHLMNGTLNPQTINRYIIRNIHKLKKTGARYIEEGLFIRPEGFFQFVPKLRRINQLKGCNMSFSKSAAYDINGFDEDFIRPAIGEDIDLTWRFEMAGYKLQSVRNLAVTYHFHHQENWSDQSQNIMEMEEKQSKGLYFCSNGLKKYNDKKDSA
ncbi:glycosyltransferase [Chitinispirillales bacterium ANBcel5]|uniref:glycosyltransferase n=1 Tax=Cellulosispirillum alkaliphilum TaxID=3039283 RepID=UPI002A527889|nr:glycosyltransferase [Chitinispirillales bacterium ANBcel5]